MPNTKAEERKMDWELTSASHGSHDDSHDSLARWLAVCQDPLQIQYFHAAVSENRTLKLKFAYNLLIVLTLG